MKIYIIQDSDYYSSYHIHGIHSMYLSKEKAQSVSNELRKEAYEAEICDMMANEEMTKDEATEWVDNNFPTWLYEVKEMEVEE